MTVIGADADAATPIESMTAIVRGEFTFAFPTIVMKRQLVGTEALDARLRTIALEREKSGVGVVRSNVGSYHSENDFFKSGIPEAEDLRQRISTAVKDYVALERQTDAKALQMLVRMEGWMNVSRSGDYAKPHVHPNSNISGVYYVDPGAPAPERPKSGLIEFLDPRNRVQMFQTEGTEARDWFIVTPAAGMMLLFPAWLYHFVNPYFGDRERVSVAFNVSIHKIAGPGEDLGPLPDRPAGMT